MLDFPLIKDYERRREKSGENPILPKIDLCKLQKRAWMKRITISTF